MSLKHIITNIFYFLHSININLRSSFWMIVKLFSDNNFTNLLTCLPSSSNSLFHRLNGSAIKSVHPVSRMRYASCMYSLQLLPHLACDNMAISTNHLLREYVWYLWKSPSRCRNDGQNYEIQSDDSLYTFGNLKRRLKVKCILAFFNSFS